MTQFRFAILSLLTLITSCPLVAHTAPTAGPLALSTDSAARCITRMHERTIDLGKVILFSESAIIQSQAEIGRLHQIMNDVLKEHGWSLEEAVSLHGQNGKKAARIHQRQANLLLRPAPRKWRIKSGRKTLLECCVVLSSYHEFQTSDGDDGQGRIALKVKDHEWARLEAERKKKSRRRNIVATTAYVSMIGVAVVYAPLLLLVFGGGFVS